MLAMELKDVKKKIQELQERANQRRIALPCRKTSADVMVENRTFEELKLETYKNIVRRDY